MNQQYTFRRLYAGGAPPTAEELNALQEQVQALSNLAVGEGLIKIPTANGWLLGLNLQETEQAESLLIVRITSSVPTNDCYPAVLESFSDDNLVISATDGDSCWFYPLNGEPVIEGQRFLVSQIATDPNG